MSTSYCDTNHGEGQGCGYYHHLVPVHCWTMNLTGRTLRRCNRTLRRCNPTHRRELMAFKTPWLWSWTVLGTWIACSKHHYRRVADSTNVTFALYVCPVVTSYNTASVNVPPTSTPNFQALLLFELCMIKELESQIYERFLCWVENEKRNNRGNSLQICNVLRDCADYLSYTKHETNFSIAFNILTQSCLSLSSTILSVVHVLPSHWQRTSFFLSSINAMLLSISSWLPSTPGTWVNW